MIESGRGPTQEQREARRIMSERFLDLLVSKVKDGSPIDAAGIIELDENFRKENAGLGDDFDLANSWRIADLITTLNKSSLEGVSDSNFPDAAQTELVANLLKEVVFKSQDE